MSHQQSMTTAQKIWLSISILVVGFFLSTLLSFFLSKSNESRLNDVSDSMFPAAILSLEALNSYKQEVTAFSDAVLMGETMRFDAAEENAIVTQQHLNKIIELPAIPEHEREEISEIIFELKDYTQTGLYIYDQAATLVLEEALSDTIEEDASFAVKLKQLADQSNDITARLTDLTSVFRENLKEELSIVREASRRQVWINVGIFFVVVLVSIAFIRTILSRATQEVIERDRAEADLRQLNEELEERVKHRTAELAEANAEIKILNEQLKAENLRMGAELEITRQLQQMVLPRDEELKDIHHLDIAGFMEPADEVGGDYYDILYEDGQVKVGIGDVTGHGLESGVVMLMTQTAVRTLLNAGINRDSVRFLSILNKTIYSNINRMQANKSLTLAMLTYENGTVSMSGQHEEVLVVRSDGQVQRVDTMDLGFPIGLDDHIDDFIDEREFQLGPGDGVVLFTDGFTEAENMANDMYGIDRLCAVISKNWDKMAQEIAYAIRDDVHDFIGEQVVHDDLTLVIVKQL